MARPRRTVEILDDAWRIYFHDPLLLLALTALFYLPAASCLVVLVAAPVAEMGPWRRLLPALTALLVPCTGLSAGACQEAFYSWAEGYPISFGECLSAACRRGLQHVATQALTLLGPVAILTCLVWPPMAGWSILVVLPLSALTALVFQFSLSQQASFAAGNPRFWRAVRHSIRASGHDFGRTLVLMALRGLLLLFAICNLHLLGNFALWAAEHLGGFDVAYLGVLLSLGNAAYVLALVLLAWCLLSPFHEAANYLFFMDVRTRIEGLDLWNRVQDLFPSVQQSKAGMLLLAVGAGLLTAGPALAEEPLEAVRGARQEIRIVRNEVREAQPYPGSRRWLPRLEAAADRLEKSAAQPGGYLWFQLALKDFPMREQPQALDLLDNLDVQLALVEESLARPRKTAAETPSADHIKSLIPPQRRFADKKKNQLVDEPKDKPKDRPPVDDAQENPGGGGFGKPVGPGVVSPSALGGAANAILVLLVGLGAALLIAGIAYVVWKWWQERPAPAPRQAGAVPPRADDYLDDPDKQDPAQLWRQADDRARAGDFLGAVRILYLAVLALLHQGGFIRYERTRTNGEYVDQLRPRALLQQPFLGLTGLFEVKWYGERSCDPDDYRRCRELAEEVRTGSVVH